MSAMLYTSIHKSRMLFLCFIVVLLPRSTYGQAFANDHPSQWAQHVSTHYHVSLQRARSQLVDITMTLDDLSQDSIDLHLPAWRPGRYEILDMAGTIITLNAHDETLKPVAFEKSDKSTWHFVTTGVRTLTVVYTIYANSLNTRTRHADDTHAFLDGSAVFLYADERRAAPCRITVDAPDGWHTATGLAPDPDIPDAWLAPDYNVLVDSPLEIGEHQIIGFAVDGTPHEIVIWGPVKPDADRLAHDFAAIVRTERDIFEGPDNPLPYGRFVYLIHAQPALGGGTEHLNSTIMQTRPSSFENEYAYNGFLGLLAHEMFHTWNVKRLRPAGIVPYDYQHENYTDLLWEAEGTTSYYTGVVLVRAGLKTVDSYLSSLASQISRERRRPGYAVQSLAQSSFDSWIKFNHPTPNDINTTVSFYSKGALVSLMLDMELRKRTNNAVSLDEVLGDLYRTHPFAKGGFATSDMLASLKRLSGSGFDAFFDRYVFGTEPLDLEDALAVAGLALTPEPIEQGSYLGISLSGNTVRAVRTDGPAFDAGVEVNDILQAINDIPLEQIDYATMLKSIEPGSQITLTLTRRDSPRTIPMNSIAKPISRWTIRRVADPSPEQRAVYESWLGASWPKDISE